MNPQTTQRRLHEAYCSGAITRMDWQQLLDLRTPDDGPEDVILGLAAFGCLDRVPRELLTQAVVTRQHKNTTVLHQAAAWQQLKEIPAELLSPENVRIVVSGYSVVDIAASTKCLDQIPIETLWACRDVQYAGRGILEGLPIELRRQVLQYGEPL